MSARTSSDADQSQLLGGDADVDHSQIIGGDAVKLLGDIYPPSPQVSAPLNENNLRTRRRGLANVFYGQPLMKLCRLLLQIFCGKEYHFKMSLCRGQAGLSLHVSRQTKEQRT